MKPALQYVLATVAGMLSAFILIALIEALSSWMHPPPAGVDLDDPEQLAKFVQSLPLSGFLMVLVAWATGSLLGTAVARLLSPQRKALPACIVWGLLMAGTIANLIMIPHPVWFTIVGIVTVLVGGILGIGLTAGSVLFETQREIHAQLETVFSTLANISEFSQAVPGIVHIEFLTDQHYGVGTRFRETRLMNGREAATVLEVTELDENRHIRLVADAGGTVWDTIFSTEVRRDAVLMKMVMEARPHQLFARLVTPLMMGIVAKAIQSDMDSIQHYCESQTS